MLRAEEVTLNLKEDVWASLHLTPEVVVAPTAQGTSGFYIALMDDVQPDLRYYLDNGRDSLPDGVAMRACFQAPGGPVVFAVDNHSYDPISWQQKAVEPLVGALREHMRTIRLAAPDNVWPTHKEGKQ